MKARFYDPDVGRFLNQDTYLGESGTPPSLHRYLYAYSNPNYYTDPSGHCVEPVTGTACATVALYTAGAAALTATTVWWNSDSGDGRTNGQEVFDSAGEAINSTTDAVSNGIGNAADKISSWMTSEEGNLSGQTPGFGEGVVPASGQTPGYGEGVEPLDSQSPGFGEGLEPVGSQAPGFGEGVEPVDSQTPGFGEGVTEDDINKWILMRDREGAGNEQNWQSEHVETYPGHEWSPVDPPMSEPPIVREGPFSGRNREGFLSGNSGGTKLSPHHRHQLPVETHGGVIDEIPGPGHVEGNQHTKKVDGVNRHRGASWFRNNDGGETQRSREIREHWKTKGERLIEDPDVSGQWYDPGPS